MKRTASVAIGAASLILSLLASSPSFAQAPAGGADPAALTAQARELFEKGVKAIDDKRWPDAHASLLAAWQLKPHYQIAVNLGVVELKLGKPRDAAEHLAFYLREAPADRKAERQRAQAQLNEAKKKIATVTFVVDVDGADLIVDRKPAGKSPMKQPVFLDPGAHGFEATVGDQRHTGDVLILNAGDSKTLSLTIPPAAPAPTPPPPAAPAPPGVAAQPLTQAQPSATDQPPAAGVTAEPTSSQSTAILIAGYSTTIVALGTGIALLGLATSQGTAAFESGKTLDSTQGSTICDAASLAAQCDTLDDLYARRDALLTAGVWTLVGAVVIGGGTTIYRFATDPKDPPSAGLVAAPVVSPQGGAIVLTGFW